MTKRWRQRVRRGSTTTSLVTILATAGGLAATAVVVGPPLLASASSGPAPVKAATPGFQETFDLLTAVITRAHCVEAIHASGQASPFLEIVLWLEDAENLGTLDVGEVAVISHSRALQTITIAQWKPPDPDDHDPPPPPDLAASDIRSLEFPAWWRSHEGVTRRVIACGVAGMRADRVGTNDGRALLEIRLTWSEDHADGPDEASARLDVPWVDVLSQRTE